MRAWLQCRPRIGFNMCTIYISYTMNESAERVSKKISEIGPKIVESMQEISHGIDISQENLEAYLDSMISGGLDKTLHRIAVRFLPRKDQ